MSKKTNTIIDTTNTKKNLFAELERIAEAVNKHGGCWYKKYDASKPADSITDLVVCHNGCIGAVGFDSIYYSINGIFVDDDGHAIVSEWAVDGTLRHSDDPTIMLDPDKWMFPAYMVYSISNGEYIARDTESMLRVYQGTLSADRSCAAAIANAHMRIGGKYFGMPKIAV